MKLVQGIGAVALALAAGAAGWMLRGPGAAPQPAAAPPVAAAPEAPAGTSLLAYPPAAPEAQAQAGSAAAAPAADRVQLLPDGSASVQVQHREPAWVLAELCRQGAQLPAGACGSPGAAAMAPAGPSAVVSVGLANDRLLQGLRSNSEAARYEALMQARSDGAVVPEAVLKSLMTSDPSERVRLEALDDYMDMHSSSDESLRNALQAVLHLPDPVLQTRAREHLDEMDALARDEAASEQQQAQER